MELSIKQAYRNLPSRIRYETNAFSYCDQIIPHTSSLMQYLMLGLLAISHRDPQQHCLVLAWKRSIMTSCKLGSIIRIHDPILAACDPGFRCAIGDGDVSQSREKDRPSSERLVSYMIRFTSARA